MNSAIRPFGLVLIAASLILPAFWFAELANKHDAGAIFSQYLGSAALIAMAWGQIMATRLPGLEGVFGGLDRMYVQHKWLGIGAMVAVLLHDTIDAEIDGLGAETWLNDLAETLGEISLYGFLALILITILTFIPYHLWKWSHKAMGAFFAASAFHFAFILTPVSLTDPLGLFVLAFCLVGIVAYIYTLLPYPIIHGRYDYVVEAIETTGDSLAITLVPEGKGIANQAGQFAFVRFEMPGLEESHPFTISSAPNSERSVRFTVKPLGGYTARLRQALSVGTKAKLSAPFGHFRLRGGKAQQVWIGAGIGITPFVAWANALKTDGPQVHLFFSTKDRDAAPHLSELEALADEKPNLTLHLVETKTEGRLTADTVIQRSGIDLKDAHAAFCGPEPMREALIKSLSAAGLRRGRFHYEEFEIRSGLGLRKLAAWIITRLSRSDAAQDVAERLRARIPV